MFDRCSLQNVHGPPHVSTACHGDGWSHSHNYLVAQSCVQVISSTLKVYKHAPKWFQTTDSYSALQVNFQSIRKLDTMKHEAERKPPMKPSMECVSASGQKGM